MSRRPNQRWNARYEAEDTPWDLGAPAPAFAQLLSSDEVPERGRAVFPGCGRGHDPLLFAERGFEVLGFDFAPRAIAIARAEAQRRGLPARFEVLDLFDLPSELAGSFDLLVEHTCFCAIDPERRDDYVATVSGLLKPGGRLLGLFFPTSPFGSGEPPPYVVTEADVRRHFSKRFEVEVLAPPPVSDPSRDGFELLGWLTKR